ncbi:MAG: AmmeMemoRadiSam system protein A [Syntrophomonadaceae bacterium]|nr:AmmeMemoRadiSam system protein A [Syntrophomonadaceae bacterium]
MIVYGALMPHPPIIIPEVGQQQLDEARVTVEGVKMLAREVQRSQPDTLVFITPHGNVFRDVLSVLTTPASEGDLADFGHPEVKSSHPSDPELLQALFKEAARSELDLLGVDEDLADRHGLNHRLDHGVLVPLYYLDKAGLTKTRVVAISIGFLPREELYSFGMAIARAAAAVPRRVAVIASGDMSHRLLDRGPYSYHPDGKVFDHKIKELLEQGDVIGILRVPPALAENAGECGYRSLVILLGAMDGRDLSSRVFSYEGPFGVGYLTAGFTPAGASQARELLPLLEEARREEIERTRHQESPLVRWARQSLETFIRENKKVHLPPDLPDELRKSAGVFVSLKKGGQLRGCIGTIWPAQDNLALEIRENAISAGTRDYRFTPVTVDELDELVYSVDVLTPPEPAKSVDELDARKYGVIVRCDGRVGVLLPDLEGVDTVAEQLRIALQKAGISPEEPYTIERFEVKRYK